MKATLISADYAISANGEPKLLEINTGTQIEGQAIANETFLEVDLISNFVQENSLTSVMVIDQTDGLNSAFFSDLSSSLANLNISSSILAIGAGNVNVPDVDDTDKLVLRICYSNDAIVDYNYARDNHELYNLYNSYGSGSYLPNSFYSSSIGENNNIDVTLQNTLSGSILPNVLVKKRFPDEEKTVFPQFYHISSSTQLETLKSSFNSDEVIFSNFIFNESNLNEQGKIMNYVRKFYLLYGSPLQTLPLGGFEFSNSAPVKLPFNTFNTDSGLLKYNQDEKLVFTNNTFPKSYYGYTDETIVDRYISGSDSIENVTIDQVNVGDEMHSIVIPGFYHIEQEDYTVNGFSFPSGSYYTSSVVTSKVTEQVQDFLVEIGFAEEQADMLVPINESVYAYISSSDTSKFTRPLFLRPGDKVYNGITGSLTVDSVQYSYYTGSLVALDTEEIDAFIGGTVVGMNLLLHNCFEAGSKVLMADGEYKNIEEIQVGEEVLSYDNSRGVTTKERVLMTSTTLETELIEIEFSNGEKITCSDEHPFLVKDTGFCSYNIKKANSNSNNSFAIGLLQEGDQIHTYSGKEITIKKITEVKDKSITTYNLSSVENNHTFIVNDMVVHNKKSPCFYRNFSGSPCYIQYVDCTFGFTTDTISGTSTKCVYTLLSTSGCTVAGGKTAC